MESESATSDSSSSSTSQNPDPNEQLQDQTDLESADVASPDLSQEPGLAPEHPPQQDASVLASTSTSSGAPQMSAVAPNMSQQWEHQPASHPETSGGQIPHTTSASTQPLQSVSMSQTHPTLRFDINGQSSPAIAGRAQSPVSGNLMAQAKATGGNFGVLKMTLRKSDQILDARSLAAKRTSEATQAAAINAGKNGYQSVKRRKLAWNPSTTDQGYTPIAAAPANQPSPRGLQHHAHTPPLAQLLPPRLNSSEVKAEQARLLTFLRSIHPVIVVDQLCKALAYFGGIPGAPPPPEHAYPASEHSNGSGSLFVGWLSEIFPVPDMTKPPFSTMKADMPFPAPGGSSGQVAPQPINGDRPLAGHTSDAQPAIRNTEAETALPGKRPRGRPKGSKSSKVRKDKGTKKGAPQSTLGAQLTADAGASVDPQPPADNLERTWGPPEFSDLSASHVSIRPESQVTMAEGGNEPDLNSSVLGTPGSAKKRGRPRGSKNRPKPVLESQLPKVPKQINLVGPEGWTPDQETTIHQEAPAFPAQSQNMEASSSPNLAAVAATSQMALNWSNQLSGGSQHAVRVSEPHPTSSSSRRRNTSQAFQSNTPGGTPGSAAGTATTEQTQLEQSSRGPRNEPAKRGRATNDLQAESQASATEAPMSGDDPLASPVTNRSNAAPAPTQTARSFNSQTHMNKQQFNSQAAGYMMRQQPMQQLQQSQQHRNQYSTQPQQHFQQQINQSSQTSNHQQISMQARARKQLPGNQLAQVQQQQGNSVTQHSYYGQQHRPHQATNNHFQASETYGHDAGLAGGRPNQVAQSFSQHANRASQSSSTTPSNLNSSSFGHYGAASGGSSVSEGDVAGAGSGAGSNYLEVQYAMGGGTGTVMAETDMNGHMYQTLGQR